MRRSLLSAVLAAAVSCSFANAAVVEEFRAEDWDGMAFTSDETGQFTHCSIFATYQNGSTLFISYEAADAWYLSISNDSWSLGEGGSFALKVRVDRRSEIDGTGVALAKNQIGLPIEADNPFITQLRRGNQLVFTFQNQEYAFELSNSNRAMNAAQDCVRRHVAAGTSTPIVTQPAEPPPPETPVATETPPAAEGSTAGTETGANATAAGEQQTFGPWVVTAANNGDGSFANCTAFGVHGDDQLILSLYPDGVWGFGLYRAAWNLDTNQTYYLWYNVDGPADATGVTKRPVEAAEPTRIYFEVSDLEDIIERIESGSTLNLQFRGLTRDPENFSYPLDQAPAAFEATRKCVADHAAASVSKEGTGTKDSSSTEQVAPPEESTEDQASEEPAEDEVAEAAPTPDSTDSGGARRELPALGQKLIEEFEVPGWKAAAFSLDDGTFTHCAIKAEYQNGATLGAALAADGELVLAVKHGDWSLEMGAWVPISFSWKGTPDFSASTEGQVAEGDNVVLVAIGNDAELTESLKNAREMTIEAEGKTLAFDVSDIGPGIDAIGACATRHAAETEETPTPPPPAAKKAEASPQTEPEPADSPAGVDTAGDTGDPRAEAPGFTTALLFRAGYPNHVILPADTEPPEGVPPGDALWQLGEIMGSTKFVDAGTPEQIEAEIGAGMSDECGRGTTTQVVASDNSHAHFTLTCGAVTTRVIHYLVVPRAAGGSYVFALLGAVDDVAASAIADSVYGTAAGS